MEELHLRHVMVFDPSAGLGGHHAEYILHLLRHWSDWQAGGQLSIVTSPAFDSAQVDFMATEDRKRIQFVPLEQDEIAEFRSQRSVLGQAFLEWELLNKYAKKLRADHVFAMYIDRVLLPLAIGAKPECNISGIYFRPAFHYKHFENYRSSMKEIVRSHRQRFIVGQALKHPMLKTLFSLDPLATGYLQQLSKRTEVRSLADPVVVVEDDPTLVAGEIEAKKRKIGVSANKTVFLLFGVLGPRKGIVELLDAITFLDYEESSRLCIMLVGKLEMQEDQLRTRIQEAIQGSGAQIILYNRFVAEKEIPLFFLMADVILATYQRHVGMSGVLLRAAASGKPVLCSEYGLLGKLTRQYELGIVVNSNDPSAIAAGLSEYLNCDPMNYIDLQKAGQLVYENSVRFFSQAILDSLGLLV